MNHEIFFGNFELLVDASNGVQKLRELILQLAVQGKLVPQDPNDKTAMTLINSIKAKKNRLARKKKIKIKNLLQIQTEEMPYSLPKGWKWIRLGDLGQTQTGTTPPKNNSEFFGKDYPFLKPGDISNNFIDYNNDGLSQLGMKNGRFIKAGSILMVCIGGSIGKVNCVDRDCSCNQQINVLSPYLGLDSRLFFYFMRSQYFQNEVKSRAPQTTLPILSKGKWELIPLPLPPLEEQNRILFKINQLMALCDELEARQQKKHKQRICLNNAALDKLLTAPTPEEFAQHWQRICDNFDLLYDMPETVGQLRQGILQMAVQGKLVAQDEGDEPAAVLLERIKDENEMLIKKLKVFTSIKEEILPFVLPNYWEWTRLGEIAEITMGNSPPGNTYNENGEGVPLINGPVEFSKGPFGLTKKSKFTTKPTKFCEESDLLICVRGSTTGRTNVAGFKACIGRGVAAIHSKVYQPYINYFILSMRQQIYNLGTGSTFPSISQKHLVSFLVPLPPPEEQKRIVAKVDQLNALCDELEAGLTQAQKDGGKLMEAVAFKLVDA